MSVTNNLASSLGRNDEIPNQELAKNIIDSGDKAAIKELIGNLGNKDKDVQSDCIKVLYEIGFHKPSLISAYASTFVSLLESKNNRLQWGAMKALDHITETDPEMIYSHLIKIVKASDNGSVITKDHAVNILIKLSKINTYAKNTLPLLIEQMLRCPTNQLPKYAEDALPLINEKNRKVFLKTLNDRLPEIDKDSKKKRLEKVIRKVSA